MSADGSWVSVAVGFAVDAVFAEAAVIVNTKHISSASTAYLITCSTFHIIAVIVGSLKRGTFKYTRFFKEGHEKKENETSSDTITHFLNYVSNQKPFPLPNSLQLVVVAERYTMHTTSYENVFSKYRKETYISGSLIQFKIH